MWRTYRAQKHRRATPARFRGGSGGLRGGRGQAAKEARTQEVARGIGEAIWNSIVRFKAGEGGGSLGAPGDIKKLGNGYLIRGNYWVTRKGIGSRYYRK